MDITGQNANIKNVGLMKNAVATIIPVNSQVLLRQPVFGVVASIINQAKNIISKKLANVLQNTMIA